LAIFQPNSVFDQVKFSLFGQISVADLGFSKDGFWTSTNSELKLFVKPAGLVIFVVKFSLQQHS